MLLIKWGIIIQQSYMLEIKYTRNIHNFLNYVYIWLVRHALVKSRFATNIENRPFKFLYVENKFN